MYYRVVGLVYALWYPYRYTLQRPLRSCPQYAPYAPQRRCARRFPAPPTLPCAPYARIGPSSLS